MVTNAPGARETGSAELRHQGCYGRFAQLFRLGPPLGLLETSPVSEQGFVALEGAL